MKFTIEGRCAVVLEHVKGEKKSRHVSTDFNLEVSENVDRFLFLDKEELPTKEGAKALTQCFVQGLVGNIHNEHQKGHWDSAEHLRYIISELEKGFSAVANVYKSEFKS